MAFDAAKLRIKTFSFKEESKRKGNGSATRGINDATLAANILLKFA